MSLQQDIAEAVKDVLNGTTFDPAFVATRQWRPTAELNDLETLTVTVVPVALAIEPGTRADHYQTVDVQIGVMRRLTGNGDAADIAEIVDLGEAIADHLRFRKLTSPAASFVRLSMAGPVQEHLDAARTVTVVITASYRVLR